MRYLGFLVLLGATTATAQSMLKCNADNCLRAVRASAFPTRKGAADCSSFLKNYVTSTVTVTATQTVSETTISTSTITVPIGQGQTVVKRQAVPTIPPYASACSGIARYSSACACVGVTVTADPATSVVPETTTTTITLVPTATVTSFVMRLIDGNPGAYVAPSPEVIFTNDINQALVFYLRPDGLLDSAGGQPGTYYTGADFIRLVYAINPITCSISPTNIVSCASGTMVEFATYAYNGYLVLGDAGTDWETYAGQKVEVEALPPP